MDFDLNALGVLRWLAWVSGLALWSTALGLTVWGTYLGHKHLRISLLPQRQRQRMRARDLVEKKGPFAPISILKPLKGCDADLEKNLESFFRLDYPNFELLFTIADSDDPARPIVEKLLARYPWIDAYLLIGHEEAGVNPKVNNLMRSYRIAQYDWILISDSNTRFEPRTLKTLAVSLAPDVGVVTALVSAQVAEPRLSASLESVFLGTFYARWMLLASWVGTPIVLGKAMLFRRSEAARFGGIRSLACYLAEDYMAGQAMRFLGRRIEIASVPVCQPLGEYSMKEFWARHLRWGRIRKSQSPLAFCFEPLLSMWLSGLIGASCFRIAFGGSMALFLIAHVLLWFLTDVAFMRATKSRPRGFLPFVWVCRELLHIPLWIHVAMGRSVIWRGTRLVLARGGVLESKP